MTLAPLLSVIRRSYLKRPPAVRRHCPPTNGVFATFLTGPSPQATVPTIVSSLVASSDSRLASGLAGSALLFPASVEALGAAGDKLSTEIWWSPHHPFKSSLSGESAAQLAAAYTDSTGRQWSRNRSAIFMRFSKWPPTS